MRTIFKVLLILLGVITLLFIGTGLFINFKKPTLFENKAPQITVNADSAMIAEGTRIASILCINCHGAENGKLSGGYMADVKAFGDLYAPNITHHATAKLDGYTDGELIYFLRTGIKKDGYYAPPWMPKFPLLSDKDIQSIVAFLRSNHPMLEAQDMVQPTIKPSFLAKALMFAVFKPLPYPEKSIPEPDTTNKVSWGKYLVSAKFDCYSCHSESFSTMNILEPEKTPGYFGGGNDMLRKDGTPIKSPNITMDEETGIGTWTEPQFIKAVRFGERPSGVATQYPMVPFTNLTNSEVSAMWAYLQTVPKIKRAKE